MKRVIKATRNITKRYSRNAMDRMESALGIAYNDSTKLSRAEQGKCNFMLSNRWERLDMKSEFVPRLKEMGAKYITSRYGDLYFYFDTTEFENAYKEEQAKFDQDYLDELDAQDISPYKPTPAIIKKLQDYRNKGSKVNVNAIKDITKLLTYFYAGRLLGWHELCNQIDTTKYSWDYQDEICAIRRQVQPDPQYADTRNEDDIELGLGNSNGLFTFEQRRNGKPSCWLPKKLLEWFIKNDIPVHFGKRTEGHRWDHNGRQWTEVEHLTLFPGEENEINYDIAVHTDEGGGTTTYTGDGTDERVGISRVIEDLDQRINK